MISKDFNCGIFNNLDNGLTALSDEDILFVERINQFQLKSWKVKYLYILII